MKIFTIAGPVVPYFLHEFRLEHEQVMKGQVAYATLDDQNRALRFFGNFIGGSVLLSKIKPRQAEAFIAHRLSTVPSVSTVNKDIRTLKRIFNMAFEPRGYSFCKQSGKQYFG